MDWSGYFTFVSMNNWTAIILITIALVSTLLLFIVYMYHINDLRSENFRKRYAAIVDGLVIKTKNSWLIIMFPLTFFLRRLLMCFTIVFWVEFFWG